MTPTIVGVIAASILTGFAVSTLAETVGWLRRRGGGIDQAVADFSHDNPRREPTL